MQQVSERLRLIKTFLGQSEMAERIYTHPWDKTTLGPITSWPMSLIHYLSVNLHSQHPYWIGWGPDLIFFYNTAYVKILGEAKHKWALGRPAGEVWAEIWGFCGPLAQQVITKGESPVENDVRLLMNRGDFTEEGFYSFSYSPLYNDAGERVGLFCPSTDVSARVLANRRLETISSLTANGLTTQTVKSVCFTTMDTLAKNPADIPFALFYLVNNTTQIAELMGATGLSSGVEAVSPFAFPLGASEVGIQKCLWPLQKVLDSSESMIFSIPLGTTNLPLGLANQRIRECVLLPVKSSSEAQAIGLLVVGVNPARKLDKEYQTFYEYLAGQISSAIQNANNHEEEKKRAEKLAELDRAKTAFFSNVSHEFRTPLTLILGPMESMLEELQAAVALNREPLLQSLSERLNLAHRNALRMLKLVNSLLDFSRIEDKGIEPVYEPTNLTELTRELASGFQAIIEKAGLEYKVDIADVGEGVYVDKEMWEKIISNLLSNAFKFTFKGKITVSLKKEQNHVVLSIQDTGEGIAETDLPRLFKRFQRIENTKGRSYEGTGIGLALIKELVKLHGGAIEVSSILGEGTTFSVSIPLGCEHLPQHLLGKKRESYIPAVMETAFVEEAARWLPTESSSSAAVKKSVSYSHLATVSRMPEETDTVRKSGRILLADDNADMRDFVAGILGPSWEVKVVSNGEEALKALIQDPHAYDVVLSDVMMPVLDGVGLVQEIRNNPNPSIKNIPVILLTAKKGEAAEMEGLESGANDYLTKPFSPKALIARINTQLQFAMRLKLLEVYRSRLQAFIGKVCHEIRNPLQVMYGCVDLFKEVFEGMEHSYANLRKKEKTETEALAEILVLLHRAKEHLITLEATCDHQQKVVDEALDLSKIEANKIELHPVPFHVQEFMRKILEIHNSPDVKKTIDLKLVIPSEIILLEADTFRLNQVISNLLSNAIKFTPLKQNKKGTITITVESEIISEGVSSLKVEVKDTGVGMSPEELKRVFVPFVQANSSISSQYGGSGLGLTICKDFVEIMGGKMQVQSQKGQGSVFSFNVLCRRLNETESQALISQMEIPSSEQKNKLSEVSESQLSASLGMFKSPLLSRESSSVPANAADTSSVPPKTSHFLGSSPRE